MRYIDMRDAQTRRERERERRETIQLALLCDPTGGEGEAYAVEGIAHDVSVGDTHERAGHARH